MLQKPARIVSAKIRETLGKLYICKPHTGVGPHSFCGFSAVHTLNKCGP
jgi:hypothetical protein